MRAFAIELFDQYAFFILFIHVLGAFVWVGGMIAMRFAIHPMLQHIEEPKQRLARTLEAVKNLFHLVLPFIVLILLTGLIMGLAVGTPGTPMGMFVHIKEAIWTVMTVNYTLMVRRRNEAERLFLSGDLAGAKQKLSPLPNVMLPLNIFLGVLALAVGISLRGF